MQVNEGHGYDFCMHMQTSIGTSHLLLNYINSWIRKPCKMALMKYTESIKKGTETSRDGRAKKYTNKIYRDNHIRYASLRLLFWGVQKQPVMSPTCKSRALNEQVRCMIIKKSKRRDYSGCDYPYKSCSCTFDPAIPTSSLFLILDWDSS